MDRHFKYILSLFILTALLVSCGGNKKVVTTKKQQNKSENQGDAPAKAPPVVSESPTNQEPIKKPDASNKIDKVAAYIAAFKDVAMTEMELYDIPASITLAQGILESGSGKGRLAVQANNHFGIKCHTAWKGERIYHDDDELQECFRKYTDPSYSYRDHSLFLTQRKRYASLFELSTDDYKRWAHGLRKAGYATDKKYPQKLISLIQRYDLDQYDQQVMSKTTNTLPLSTKTQKIAYTVKKGDTLYSLSKKYNLTVKELKDINELTTVNLTIGQQLIIPVE